MGSRSRRETLQCAWTFGSDRACEPWTDTLPMRLGHTEGSTVRAKTCLKDPEATARQWWRNSGYKVAANGSLMRTHALGLMCLQKSLEQTFQTAADLSVITHPDPRCIISCAISTALARGLLLHMIRMESDIEALIKGAVVSFAPYRQEQRKGQDEDEDAGRLDEPTRS